MKSSDITFKTGVPEFPVDPLNRVTHNFVKALHAIEAWRFRARSRYALRHLSSHALNDIGIDRGEAGLEADKPFWRN